VQSAEKEHHRLIKLREEYQSTCTQALMFEVASKEANKLSSQIDLAFSVEFNLAIQVIKFTKVYAPYRL